MKTFSFLVTKVLVAIIVIQAWFLYDLHQKNQQLLSDNIALESQLLSAEQELVAVIDQMKEMEDASFEGLLKDTNKVLASKWGMLLNLFQNELNKAKEAIPLILDDGASNVEGAKKKQSPAPQVETERNRSDNQEKSDFPSIEGERT